MKKFTKFFMSLILAIVFVVPIFLSGCDLLDNKEKTIDLKKGSYNVVAVGPDSAPVNRTYENAILDSVEYNIFSQIVVKENNTCDLGMLYYYDSNTITYVYREFNDISYKTDGRKVTLESEAFSFENIQIIDEETLYVNESGFHLIFKWTNDVELENGKYVYDDKYYFEINDNNIKISSEENFKPFKVFGNIVLVEYDENITWATRIATDDCTWIRLNMVVNNLGSHYDNFELLYSKV